MPFLIPLLFASQCFTVSKPRQSWCKNWWYKNIFSAILFCYKMHKFLSILKTNLCCKRMLTTWSIAKNFSASDLYINIVTNLPQIFPYTLLDYLFWLTCTAFIQNTSSSKWQLAQSDWASLPLHLHWVAHLARNYMASITNQTTYLWIQRSNIQTFNYKS